MSFIFGLRSDRHCEETYVGLITDGRGASFGRINDSTIDMGAFETLSLGTKALQLLYTSSNLNVRLTSTMAAPLDVGTFPLTDKLMFGGFGADDSVQVDRE